MLRSLHIKGKSWKVSRLGEKALLFHPEVEGDLLHFIHSLTRTLEELNLPGVVDIIPAYESIALVHENNLTDIETYLRQIEKALEQVSEIEIQPSQTKIPVCYELGLDWQEVVKHTSLSKQEIIAKHTNGEYTLAMMGFLPGFLYLSGMHESITCPRKENPRTKIPAGSVGIGGSQTGIYSLESPGGWQVIGRTPVSFFNSDKNPPVSLSLGDTISFYAISNEEFETFSQKKGAE